MSDEEDRKRSDATVTVPPPEGEDDIYEASTKVGQASPELLALVRAAEVADADPSHSKEATDTKLEAMKEAAALAAKEAAAHEVVRRSLPPGARGSVAPAKPRDSAVPAKAQESTAPVAEPVREPEVAETAEREAPPVKRRPEQETTKRRAVTEPERPARGGGGLPPALAIALVFIAAALALAMIVR